MTVRVWCKACRHSRNADLAALIAAGRGDTRLVRIRWRCGNCRSRLTDFVISGSHLRPPA
jgi:formate dehydrogenase maturation protein FdhE